MKRTLLALAAVSGAIACSAPAHAADDWQKYGPIGYTAFCNATPWGGVDTGYGEWWGSLSGEDLSRSINAKFTGPELKTKLAEAFKQGTTRISKPCGPGQGGASWAALDKGNTNKDEFGRTWKYGPQTCQIIETMMCDRTGAFFDPGMVSTSAHKVCQTQIKAYLKANPMTAKTSYWAWGGDAPTTYNEVIYSCAADTPPEPTPETTDSNISVNIGRPSLPAYGRAGMTLKQTHDDFTTKR